MKQYLEIILREGKQMIRVPDAVRLVKVIGVEEVCSHERDLKKNPPWINFSK
jgi:hypothetical protein